MTVAMSFRGTLVFASVSSAAAALKALDALDEEEGCFVESAVARADLKRTGARITVDVDGSFPASQWDITSYVLETLSEGAASGAIIARFDDDDDAPLVEVIGPDAPIEEPEDPAASKAAEAARLALAVRNGTAAEVQALLAAGADAHWALHIGPDDPAVVELLLDAGCSVNGSEEHRPLAWAAQLGQTNVVRLLLARGADPNAAARFGSMPLAAAASFGKARIVELLLAAGAELEREGHCALHDALRNRGASRKKVIEVLLRAGARLDAKDRFGETAMDVAKKYGGVDELVDVAERVRASKDGAVAAKKTPKPGRR